MTYWGYHLVFTLPAIAILLWLVRKRLRIAHLWCYLVVCGIVMLFTTPWDNYAAFLGIWGFGEDVSLWWPFRDIASNTPLLGHIPFEEYAYFLIQTTLAVLFTILLLPAPKKVQG